MISGVNGNELRARERRALNEITVDERVPLTPDEVTRFACECGELGCRAVIRLTPREFAAFRQNFKGFIVATDHEVRQAA
jgi:hypothetical protein